MKAGPLSTRRAGHAEVTGRSGHPCKGQVAHSEGGPLSTRRASHVEVTGRSGRPCKGQVAHSEGGPLSTRRASHVEVTGRSGRPCKGQVAHSEGGPLSTRPCRRPRASTGIGGHPSCRCRASTYDGCLLVACLTSQQHASVSQGRTTVDTRHTLTQFGDWSGPSRPLTSFCAQGTVV